MQAALQTFHRLSRRTPHTEKVPIGLGQLIAHHLKTDMRRPAAILGPITQMRDQLARPHPLPRLQKAGQRTRKMPLSRDITPSHLAESASISRFCHNPAGQRYK